jgi:hypothetical protein
MADPLDNRLPHLFIKDPAKTELYRHPVSGGGSEFRLPPRNRKTHGRKLLSQLQRLRHEAEAVGKEQAAFGIGIENGIYVEFESEPDFDLKSESLEAIRSGIELVNVRRVGRKTYAVCFVPEGQISHFVKLVVAYLENETKKGNPRNRPLVESISAIRRAVLEALWTDEAAELPEAGRAFWWEVWLRAGDKRDAFLSFFRDSAAHLGLSVTAGNLRFPDRTVLLAHGTKAQMSRSVELLNSIAELRKAKETAEFFTAMTPPKQQALVDDAISRMEWPMPAAPAVCLLDTGVNNEHPLLRPALEPSDMHTYDPAWSVTDHSGHGTEMAGLALHGDLTEVLVSSFPTIVSHRLESVKILPPRGQNPPDLYGAITTEAIARAEIEAPERQRTFCMAVTTTDFRDKGKPSSWSASLDKLASGADDGKQRLIIVSAGNTDPVFRHLYPNSNNTDQVHDPGQSWNALTVGAFTEKIGIDPVQYPDWTPIAPQGDLSPCSCTSRIWQRPWPLKPDVVMEGGNMAIDPGTGTADFIDSLSLLTTNWHFTQRSLVVSGDTSAATAQAARVSAMIWVAYEDYWPETIRGLVAHSADWTEAMKRRFQPLLTRNQKETLLRNCGFGVPSLEKALWSARNALTLVAQDSLQPFDKFDKGYKTRDLNLHHIPWPVDTLEGLGETQVEMRVTLSYFVEPNPARRGWTRKYSYMSHGLGFEVKTPTETLDEFRRRINQIARNQETGGRLSKSDAGSWFLGPDLRALGSLHSDRWNGSAAELAQRGVVAVYPVIGWWRERHQLGRWDKRARYSLIISISTPETDVDLYTPIVNLIKPLVEITV